MARQHRFPGSAAGLVLTGAPLLRLGERRKPPVAYRIVRLAHRMGLISDERMERERRRRGSADYRAAQGVMRDILVKVVNESYEEELSGLGVPVHLLWGADDTEVPVAVAEEAQRIVAASGAPVTCEVIEGVGHHVPLQAPEALRKAVESMLERVGR